ncbi:MAG: hypothetical protein HC831_26175 [Chloroflexia bacterium]|nr:hypothetical protein [Chloroflexia bacterium]
MSAKLIVKNFGPLKNVEIKLKGINIFIGETASGKSVLSKLAALFTDSRLLKDVKIANFSTLLKYYDIDIYLRDDTYILFKNSDFYIKYDKDVLISNLVFKTPQPFLNSFDNIVDYLSEWQSYLSDVICSDKKAYVSIGNREEVILGFLNKIQKNVNVTAEQTNEIELLKKE